MESIIDAREVLGTVTRYFEELDGSSVF